MNLNNGQGTQLLAVGLVGLIAFGSVLFIHRTDPGNSVIAQAQAQVKQVQDELAQVQQLPDLPPIEGSWTKFKTLIDSCGLEVAFTQMKLPDGAAQYPNSWSGTITGTPLQTLSCAWMAINQVPVIFDGVSWDSGAKKYGSPDRFALDFHVLGAGAGS